jgi:hypothetical protein
MKGSPASSEHLPLAAEQPPSYDYALAQPPSDEPQEAGPSSSTATEASGSASGTIPKNNQHLFSGPPNAEPLYGRINTTLGDLGEIATHTKGPHTESWDPKLSDRTYITVFLSVVIIIGWC